MNTLTNYLKFSTYWLLVGFMQYSWILVAVGIITAVALKNHYSSAATPVLHTAPSVYGNDPNLGIYSFLRDDESSPFNTAGQQYRRNNSVYLSRIAQISGFWGAQHLQFGWVGLMGTNGV
jgi:hypothetical protein